MSRLSAFRVGPGALLLDALLLGALLLGCVLALAMAAPPAAAIGVDRPLPDPAQEARAHELSKDLRCLVCQNQTIAESDADLARDLRAIIREQVAAGESDAAIRAYLVDRYGEWILMRPTFSWRNAILWAAPALVLLAGIAVIVLRRRGRSDGEPADNALRPLDPAEAARLAALLERDR